MGALEDYISSRSLGEDPATKLYTGPNPRWEDPTHGFKVSVTRDGKLAQESEVDIYRDEPNQMDSKSTQRYKYNVRKQRPLNLSDKARGRMAGQWLREQAEAGTLGQYQYNERDMADAIEFNKLFNEMNSRENNN